MKTTADDIIKSLDLAPHPEGGYYREIFRADTSGDGARAAVTSIYFLLARGQRSHWHRVDAVEIWNYHAGSPLCLEIAESDDGPIRDVLLGPDIGLGQEPQGIVPVNAWQAAETLGDWTLVGCQVAPGFDFSGFEMAPPDWCPGD